MMYGKELILDLHDCVCLPCSRSFLGSYLKELCELICMERAELYFWDYEGLPEEYENAAPHLKGISAVQFIMTSNITIHTLDDLKKVFINIFSCRDFDADIVVKFSEDYFRGCIVSNVVVERR